MHNVKFHSERATEDQIITAIFDACRANEARETKTVRGDMTVQFHKSQGLVLAIVVNKDLQRCGSALVDQFDR